jgi:hypothetical protein
MVVDLIEKTTLLASLQDAKYFSAFQGHGFVELTRLLATLSDAFGMASEYTGGSLGAIARPSKRYLALPNKRSFAPCVPPPKMSGWARYRLKASE